MPNLHNKEKVLEILPVSPEAALDVRDISNQLDMPIYTVRKALKVLRNFKDVDETNRDKTIPMRGGFKQRVLVKVYWRL